MVDQGTRHTVRKVAHWGQGHAEHTNQGRSRNTIRGSCVRAGVCRCAGLCIYKQLGGAETPLGRLHVVGGGMLNMSTRGGPETLLGGCT